MRRIEYKGDGDWMMFTRLPEPLARRMKAELDKTGLSASEVARSAITEYLTTKGA